MSMKLKLSTKSAEMLLEELKKEPALRKHQVLKSLKVLAQNQMGKTELTNDRILELLKSSTDSITKRRFQSAISGAIARIEFEKKQQAQTASQLAIQRTALQELLDLKKGLKSASASTAVLPGEKKAPKSQKQKELETKLSGLHDQLDKALKRKSEAKEKLHAQTKDFDPEGKVIPREQMTLRGKLDGAKTLKEKLVIASQARTKGVPLHFVRKIETSNKFRGSLDEYGDAATSTQRLRSEIDVTSQALRAEATALSPQHRLKEAKSVFGKQETEQIDDQQRKEQRTDNGQSWQRQNQPKGSAPRTTVMTYRTGKITDTTQTWIRIAMRRAEEKRKPQQESDNSKSSAASLTPAFGRT